MANKPNSQPPELKMEIPKSLVTGFIFMVAVLLALPISQLISDIVDRKTVIVEPIDLNPPPLIQQETPPEDEQEEQEIDEMEKEPERITLEQLDLMLNPDLSGFGSSDFTMPQVDFAAAMDEIIYDLGDLTRQPRRLSGPAPQTPHELRRAGISGRVVAVMVIRMDGSVGAITIEYSDNPAFDEAVIRAVRKWRWEPGEKDGKAVNTRVRMPFLFNVDK